MNFETFKNLKNLNESDFEVKSYAIPINYTVDTSKKMIKSFKKMADNFEIVKLFYLFHRGVICGMLDVINLVILIVMYTVAIPIRLLYYALGKFDFYIYIVYPLAFMYYSCIGVIGTLHLYNTETYLYSEKIKAEQLNQFEQVHYFMIWTIFFRNDGKYMVWY
jgi:hypothetical protein